MKSLASKTTLLVIDDDEIDREQIRRLLAKDYHILEAAGGSQGIEAFASSDAGCVLLDYRLPDMDGLEVLSCILEEREDAAVVMLTGEGSEEVAVEAMNRGAGEYLIKDFLSARVLRRSIESAQAKARLQGILLAQREEFRTFAHTAAHDLRAPLRKIRAWSEILEEACPDALPEEGRDMLGRIRGSIVEMEGLIEGLLHYARMGELKPGTEIVSLDKALESALSNLQRVVEAKRATVEAGELPSVRGDVTALSLLLQNLVGNALKFHDGQPHIEVSAQRSDGEWIVTVSDDGIGIDPEHLERIFKPFERLHGKNQYEGSGLGLATCARIVEAHGGRIWADAQVGQGTRVLVAFPIAAPEAASPTTDGVELDQSVRR